MKSIKIKVIPNAKKNNILKEGDILKVRVTAPAIDGRANKAAIEALAEFFKVKKRCISIIRGEKTREEDVKIYDNTKPLRRVKEKSG